MKRLQSISLVACLLATIGPASATDWPVFGFDAARTSFNSAEHSLGVATVGRLRARWQISYGTLADTAPILLEHVRLRGGVVAPMLFQTTNSGVTLGVNATTGKILWRFATSGPHITTAMPAADPSGSAIYAAGVDGFIHKLDAATGRQLRAPGFPARITRIPQTEKDASGFNLANGYLYATTSGYDGDAPYYDGHVLAVNLVSGSTRVFNSLCSSQHVLPTSSFCPESDSGIWARGGVVVDPDASMHGAIYAATGNGEFNANKGGDDYGDSVISLSTDASHLLASYTPKSEESLDTGDVDLGSTSPGMLPRQNGSRTPLMLVQGGKDAVLRLLDRAPLPGGLGHELQEVQLPSGLWASPAVWTDRAGRTFVFISTSNELDAFRVVTAAGRSRLISAWHSNAGSTNGEGTTPAIANGLVFVAYDNALLAFDAETGRTLWSSTRTGRTIGPVHWESPIVVNGWVYCADQNGHLTAYSL